MQFPLKTINSLAFLINKFLLSE